MIYLRIDRLRMVNFCQVLLLAGRVGLENGRSLVVMSDSLGARALS